MLIKTDIMPRDTVKTTLKTSRKPTRIDSGVISLFSRPSDFSWIIDINGECWLVETGKSGLTLCGYCKLSIDPDGYDRRRDACKGLVRVVSETPQQTCVLGFSNWSGSLLNRFVEIKAQYTSIKSAKWVSGYHEDGWIDVDAVLRVEGAEMVEVEMYLPGEDDRIGAKTLDILYHSEPITSVELVRGQVQRVLIPTAMAKQDSVELLIESEYAEDLQGTGDERLLGCVVTDVRLVEQGADPGAS